MEKREPSQEVVNALSITAEIYGKDFTRAAATMLAKDLLGFPPGLILDALSRCRRELRNFPTVADIVSRVQDGRPGPEEAWAMIPRDEAGSIVWSDEMQAAYLVCLPLLEENPISARMAFLEAYRNRVAEKRAKSLGPIWSPSFGTDPLMRDVALIEALQLGRMPMAHVMPLLREPEAITDPSMKQLIQKTTKSMPRGISYDEPGGDLSDRKKYSLTTKDGSA